LVTKLAKRAAGSVTIDLGENTMTKNLKEVANVAALAATLPDLIGTLHAELEDINGRMATLKKAGLIYAGIHMKDGKYLVLVHPSEGGEQRRREYIGKDPRKIQEAKDAVQRAKDYDALGQDAEGLLAIVAQAHRSLREAAQTLAARRRRG
jgi:hypothetical protein